MGEKSWMMLGSTMDIFMDALRTREVGPEFGFKGSIVGVPLFVREVVTLRQDRAEDAHWSALTRGDVTGKAQAVA